MSSIGPEPVQRLAHAAARWSAPLAGIRLQFGVGARHRLPEIVERLGSVRPLLVTDPGVHAATDVDTILSAMRALGQQVAIFDRVAENPTSAHVADGAQVAVDHCADLVVGFGGGSAMDAAKGINFIATNGGRMEDWIGFRETPEPMLPSVGIPTTAGTGSEAQSYALISRDDDHVKMACGAPGARFREVILDPEVTATVPRAVEFAAGIDAVAHAVESYVCTRANPVSRMYAREAFRLLYGNLEVALSEPDDREAAGRMLLGAHLAGAAIEASMLGAAHACANPLTARHELVHGVAVGLMLPHVVAFNEPEAGGDYRDLCRAAGAGESLVSCLRRLWSAGRLPARLSAHGIDAAELPTLAREAAAQWTSGFNPRPVGESELLQIYENAY